MSHSRFIPSNANRAMLLLAMAAFASQATVRVADTLLSQIAADFGTTVGAASIVVVAFAASQGIFMLLAGPLGDRFGKYRVVAIACGISAVMVLLCGLAQSVTALALLRFASGVTVSWIVPLGLAFVADIVPYEQRQPVLARYMSGQILGQLFGQAAAGVIGDYFGWRGAFLMLGTCFLAAAAALAWELANNPLTWQRNCAARRAKSIGADYVTVLSDSWACTLLLAVFLEGFVSFGVFTFVGAHLHARFGLSFTAVGGIIAMFAVGGLAYGTLAKPLLKRLGEAGIAVAGGLALAAAYFMLAVESHWWTAAPSVTAIGLGYYMLHNTLLTNATQMCPQLRATAISLFGAGLYLGQTAGTAFSAPVVECYGARAVFLASAAITPAVVFWFASRLERRRATAAAIPALSRAV